MFDDMSLRLCEKYGDGRKQFPVDNNNFVAVDKKPVEWQGIDSWHKCQYHHHHLTYEDNDKLDSRSG